MKRLAIIRTSNLPFNPIFYNVQEIGLANALLPYGIITDIYYASNNIHKPEVSFYNNKKQGRLIRWPIQLGFPKHQAILANISSVLIHEDYDLIQINDSLSLGTIKVATEIVPKKSKVILHQGIYFFPNVLKRTFQTLFEFGFSPFLRNKIDGCIAKSQEAAKYLEYFKYPNIEVIPIGLDINQLSIKQEEKSIRTEIGIPPNAIILLYIGKLESRRRPDVIIKVCKELVQLGMPTHVIFIGIGPLREYTIQLAKEAKILSYVNFIDSVPQKYLSNYYKESNFLIHPSQYEIYGMTILESIFFGLPVITTKTAGSNMILNHTGIIMDNLDPKEWALKIKSFWGDQQKYQELKKNTMQNSKRFTWQFLGDKYYQFYIKYLEG
jgi:glycosyltransferase involved in cell wall biosynthesis